jgi:hypothetical protein
MWEVLIFEKLKVFQNVMCVAFGVFFIECEVLSGVDLWGEFGLCSCK